jgi:DNA-binding transcriptional MerR regulator
MEAHMEDWISKRELLEATGISYGQLYRWKREKLIPDSWFVKRSAFTGQETFLPRKAVERIQFILSNKDRYSLTQLQDMISPEAKSRSYPASAVGLMPGAARPAQALRNLLGSEEFDHGQALCAMIAADMIRSGVKLDDATLKEVLGALAAWQKSEGLLEKDDGRIVLLKSGEAYLPLYFQPDGVVRAPEGVTVAWGLSLSDLPEKINRPLNRLMEEEKVHE